MKLTPAEERALLRRIEEGHTTAADVLVVEALLDAASNASLLAAIREMTQALTESARAEATTSSELVAWREKLAPLLEALAAEEERRNDHADARLEHDKAQLAAELEMKKLRLREIVVPIVTALLAGGAAYLGA